MARTNCRSKTSSLAQRSESRSLPGLARVRCDSGSALTIVLYFVTFATITVVVFMSGEHLRTRAVVREPAKIQAVLAARAGVWKAVKFLADSAKSDSIEPIQLPDFRQNLLPVTTDTLTPLQKLCADSGFHARTSATDSFGTASVMVTANLLSVTMTSTGVFRDREQTGAAELAGRVFSSPDTVLFLDSPTPPSGAMFSGQFCSMSTISPLRKDVFTPRTKDLQASLTTLQGESFKEFDSTFTVTEFLVKTNEKLAALPDQVEGALLIDGSVEDLSLQAKRTISISGDLQITGTVLLKDITICASGSIKVFDEAVLRNVNLYAGGELFIGDEAQFSGRAIAMKKIVVYGRAAVTDRSLLMVPGTAKTTAKADPASTTPPTPPDQSGKTPPASPGTPSSTQPDQSGKEYSIWIQERATVDASVFSLGTPGGIKTDKDAKVQGILWAEGTVCHLGTLTGILKARKVVDCSVPTGTPPTDNALPGRISKLDRSVDIRDYPVPFFLGEYVVKRWIEGPAAMAGAASSDDFPAPDTTEEQ